MPTILGIESTAHTFGVAVVKNGKVISNVKRVYTTEEGGMIPIEVAKFHFNNKHEIYFEALDKAGIKEGDIDVVAFSRGPGLAPCLLEGMKFAKELSVKLDKPIIPVNHCIAHLEIGKTTGARNPVMLYVSGANTQIIAYASGRYRIFGETLDLGVGNFIDNFGRYAGIGFPAGPKIEKLASTSRNYIELPYKVKGMDIALSGILTNLRQKLERPPHLLFQKLPAHLHSRINKVVNKKQDADSPLIQRDFSLITSKKFEQSEAKYSLADLAYSMQETVFAMLVETAERALAHTGKKELLLGGGVACNSRLVEMCEIMCKERGAKLFVPEKQFLLDNAGMIGFLGEIIFRSQRDDSEGPKNGGEKNLDKIDISPRERTDDVSVGWK